MQNKHYYVEQKTTHQTAFPKLKTDYYRNIDFTFAFYHIVNLLLEIFGCEYYVFR